MRTSWKDLFLEEYSCTSDLSVSNLDDSDDGLT